MHTPVLSIGDGIVKEIAQTHKCLALDICAPFVRVQILAMPHFGQKLA